MRTVKAVQLALRLSAALVPPKHALDGVLRLAGRTPSQIELSSHTNCSAKASTSAGFGYRLLTATVYDI